MVFPVLDDYTIAWICALPSEAAAARVMLDRAHPLPRGFSDPNAYEFGEIHGHYIVIAYLPNGLYGTTSAAAVASRMALTFPRLRYGLMVGIGGGVPGKNNDIRLGDVVVSNPGGSYGGVIQYDFGKTVQDGRFVQTGTLNQPPHVILSQLSQVKAKQMTSESNAMSEIVSEVLDRYPSMRENFSPPEETKDFLFNSSYGHPDKETDCAKCDKRQLVKRQPRDTRAPCVHYGLIASGNQVMKDSRTRDRLAKEYGILCFEMEAAGLMNMLPTLVIRGICDYCDSHKQKQWQGYAALTAAAFAKVLLSVLPVQVATTTQLRHEFTAEEKHCLQELLLSHPEDELKRIEATKGGLLRDSFQWVLDNSELRKWHSDSQSQLLWIKGDPGKGKTMLVIGMIDELSRQAQQSHSIAYFMCQATNPKLNNATSILRGLIYMLIQQQPRLILHLRARYDTDPKLFESGHTFYSLSSIFENLIQDSSQATTYLLVDALDECESGLSDLLKLIGRTKFMSAARVKWMVSSRNRDDIEQELEFGNEETKLSLELNASHVSSAVAVYINHRVSRMKVLQHNGILLQQVKEQLLQKSDGTFLWVALVVQEMQKCRRVTTLLEWLERTPRGLVPLYDRMLKEIHNFESLDRESCILVLSIITLGYRPLHLHELCLIAGLHEQLYGYDDLKNIVGMCGSFLTIREDYVYLIHQSAKDYLSDVKVSAVILPSGPSEIHHRIFHESLQNLSARLRRNIYNFDDPAVSASEIETPPPDRDPLINLRYSCTYWLDHFLETHSISAHEIISKDHTALSNFLQDHLLHWLEGLSLIGEVRHGILALRKLVHQLTGQKQDKSIFKEFERFATSYGSVIQEMPLQVYSTAIAFCPQASESKKLYWGERLDFLDHAAVMLETWDPCMQVLEGHRGQVQGVAFSPDGQTVASASWDGTVRLWDAAMGTECHTLQGHRGQVQAVAFSPDGQTVASASWDGTVRLWDAAMGTECHTLQGHRGQVQAVAFSPDGLTVASASDDYTVCLWNAATGVKHHILQGHRKWVNAVAFSPDGKTVASASDDYTVCLWNAATGVKHHILQGHRGQVQAVAFSPDGLRVASAARDRAIRLWDAVTGVRHRTLTGHTAWVQAVAFSSDGQIVASASRDYTVRLWNVATGLEPRILQGHTAEVQGVAFSPDGQTVASASRDGTVRLWDVAIGTECHILQGHRGKVQGVAFSPDGLTVASASADFTVRLWDVAMGVEHRTLQGHTSRVQAMAISPDRQTVASASRDGTVRLWNAASGTEQHILQGHRGEVQAVAFSPNGLVVASASADYIIRLWDAATGVKCHTMQGHTYFLKAVTFSPDGQTVASASLDHTVRLWDVTKGVERCMLQGHREGVLAVTFSPDGQMVASASLDRTVCLWDVATGVKRHTLQGHTYYINAVAFSPDGQTVASASLDRTVRLWDVAMELDRYMLQGHTDEVYTVAFAPDGQTVASASRDGTVRLWNAATGIQIENHQLDVVVSTLSFLTNSCLATNRGSLSLSHQPLTPLSERQENEIFVCKNWVTRNKQRLIWLSPDYRATCAVTSGNSVVLGHDSGRLTFLWLN